MEKVKKRKVILAMQMTLDGSIEGPNQEMDWLIAGDDVWAEMFKDLANVDTYLLGRKMYPGYAGYWRSVLSDPSSPSNSLKYARLADQSQHIVFSKSKFVPEWKNTKASNSISEEIGRLQEQPGKNIVAWGGATLASALINLGLIDEYRITLNPTLLPGGKSLFKDVVDRKRLNLLETRPMPSGVIIVRYSQA